MWTLTFGSGHGYLEEIAHLLLAQNSLAHYALQEDAVLVLVHGSHLEWSGTQVIDGHRCLKSVG